MADDRDLVVLIAGRRAGVVAMNAQGRFALRYDEEYRAGRSPTPLSLSMPLARSDHGDGPVRAFLWGLLPDNEHVLQRWARTYQVSAGNPFALLRHVGEDCAGAAQFVRPERVIVVERYDRLRGPVGVVTRIHQEDTCQALGRSPATKYQNEGGPDPEQIITMLREHVVPVSAATDAVNRFVDALAYNWIIGGTDAHAKNYSVLLSGSQVRLARLYDIASALPYDDMYVPKLRMAMKIGGEYGLDAVHGRHWRRFAADNRLDPDETVARVDDLATRIPEAFATSARETDVRALNSRLPSRLTDRVAARATHCRKKLKQ